MENQKRGWRRLISFFIAVILFFSLAITEVLPVHAENYKCPICNEYTSSMHSILRPIELKYLKVIE